MKMYLIPVESICNGKCNFCITKSRNKISSDFINITKLNNLNKFKNIQKIEITGGGEPSFHPKINEIINYCSKRWNTCIYTNGRLSPPKNTKIEICVSRVHYDDKVNEQIMGVKYDFDKYKNFRVKLSLMLHKDGINSIKKLEKYLFWAKEKGVSKVVIRRIAYNDNWESYQISKKYNAEVDESFIKKIKDKFGNFVDFDLESCDNYNLNLIMRSNGEYYLDWDSLECLSEDRFLIAYLKKISKTSTCLGRKVSSIIIKDGNVLGIGSNSGSDCRIKKVCNRVITGKNEDYSDCLCTHAEINAINDALSNNNDVAYSKMFVYGIHNVCDNCKKILGQHKIKFELIK